MPARLAIQASRVHNAWLYLIWIVLFFRPQAKKAMRTVNATATVSVFTALSVVSGRVGRKRRSRPRPPPLSYSGLSQATWVSDLSRKPVSPAKCRNSSAVGSAVRFAKRGGTPRRDSNGYNNKHRKSVTFEQLSQLSPAAKHI